jgi:chemotaxis methyl-accepting protein methylase
LSTDEPGHWDLILCRNLGMYLKADLAGQLWNRLARALRPGGWLVLGKAERPMGASILSAVSPCLYRRDRG